MFTFIFISQGLYRINSKLLHYNPRVCVAFSLHFSVKYFFENLGHTLVWEPILTVLTMTFALNF